MPLRPMTTERVAWRFCAGRSPGRGADGPESCACKAVMSNNALVIAMVEGLMRGSNLKMTASEPIEQLGQRFPLEGERAKVVGPREFIALSHRRDPDLAYRRVRRHDEPCLGRLFEKQVEDAVLKLNLEPFLVRQRQKGPARILERRIALHAEFLFRQCGHDSLNLSSDASV